MSLKFRITILGALSLFSISSNSEQLQAQIVINEVYPDLPPGEDESEGEWLELYNSSDKTVTFNSNLILEDLAENQLEIKPASPGAKLKFAAHEYRLIYRNGASFSLNNNGDQVVLIEATQGGKVLDKVSYSESSPDYSWSRIPDGQGDLQKSRITPGSTNQPLPTPTPTPTPTPEPSPTSTTKTQSSQQSLGESEAVNTSSPTPRAIASSPVASQTTQDFEASPDSDLISSLNKSISGIQKIMGVKTEAVQPKGQVDSTYDSASTRLPIWFYVSGLSLVGLSLIRIVKKIRRLI